MLSFRVNTLRLSCGEPSRLDVKLLVLAGEAWLESSTPGRHCREFAGKMLQTQGTLERGLPPHLKEGCEWMQTGSRQPRCFQIAPSAMKMWHGGCSSGGIAGEASSGSWYLRGSRRAVRPSRWPRCDLEQCVQAEGRLQS